MISGGTYKIFYSHSRDVYGIQDPCKIIIQLLNMKVMVFRKIKFWIRGKHGQKNVGKDIKREKQMKQLKLEKRG